MEELKRKIVELKEKDPVKMKELEEKFEFLRFDVIRAKKDAENQEIVLAEAKGNWIKDNTEENLALMNEEERNLEIAKLHYRYAVEKMELMKAVVFLLS